MKNRKKRFYSPLILLFAVVVLVAGGVDTTVAWLMDQTEEVVNTFTYGDIELKLDETQVNEDGELVDENGDLIPDGGDPFREEEGNTYKMVPGKEYLKDPMVTVLAGNEACWLFVKLEELGGTAEYTFDDYLEYEIAEGWTQLKDAGGADVEGVYFRQVGEDTDDIAYTLEVLKDNKISVKTDVDKDMLNALDDNGQNVTDPDYPELQITAYAVQYSGFEPADDTADAANAAAYGAWLVAEADTTTP